MPNDNYSFRGRDDVFRNRYAVTDIEALYFKQSGKCAECQTALGNDYHCTPHIIGVDDEIKFVRLLCPDCDFVSHTLIFDSLKMTNPRNHDFLESHKQSKEEMDGFFIPCKEPN